MVPQCGTVPSENPLTERSETEAKPRHPNVEGCEFTNWKPGVRAGAECVRQTRNMITKKRHRDGHTKVVFSLPDAGQPVSVVADFNGWDPTAHPLRKRSNGGRSAAVTVPAGATLHFRYLAEGGHWFDDDTAGTPSPAGVTLTIPA